MNYIITFMEGVASFISPCILPLLPIYISCFGGQSNKKTIVFLKALCFSAGFSAVFCLLGFFVGGIGQLLHKYHGAVDIVCGIIIILLGLNFTGVIRLPTLKGFHSTGSIGGFFSSFILGALFSVGHAPCISAFLGTALISASASGNMQTGFFMMLSYSLGLAFPFLISAMVIDSLNKFFEAMQRNYRKINIICGVFLVLLGILMATGIFHSLMH